MPYQGIYDRLPAIAVQNPFCQYLLNFNISPAGLTLRNGDDAYFYRDTGATTSQIVKFAKYGDTSLFTVEKDTALNTNRVVDTSSGVVVHTFGAAYATSFATLFFNNNLFIFPDRLSIADGVRYDGTTWAASTYTSASGRLPFGGTVYKNRAYLLAKNRASYMYTEINAIAGALNDVDLQTVIEEKGILYGICTINIADATSSEQYLVFLFSTGEVLFYQGSYPSSSDWRLVSRSSISPPLGYDTFISYQGDTLVVTTSGLISLRDLFLQGSQGALSLSISKNITQLWSDTINSQVATYGHAYNALVSIVWNALQNTIIVSFPYYIDPITGTYDTTTFLPTFFIFNTELGAWTLHRTLNIDYGDLVVMQDMIEFNGMIYYLVAADLNTNGKYTVYKKEARTDFQDDTPDNSGASVSYDFYVQSAPITQNNGYVNKVQGMDVILESDLSATTEYTLIKELGVDETSAQKVTFGSGIQKPFVNLGIEGTYVQYKISGTTAASKTVGLDLYGVNIWQDQGASPR